MIDLGDSRSRCLEKGHVGGRQTVGDARLMLYLAKATYSMDHLIKEGLFEFPSGAQADKVARLLTRLHFFGMLPSRRVGQLGPGHWSLTMACPSASPSQNEADSHVRNGRTFYLPQFSSASQSALLARLQHLSSTPSILEASMFWLFTSISDWYLRGQTV